MSSSNKINYSVRVNKSIERKIIAEGISNVISKLELTYQYIGFGSLWFTDFIYFHKALKIDDMTSIERDPIIFERANYNKPFSCIKLIRGDSSDVLQAALLDNSKPAVIWLDYDDNVFHCSSYLADVDSIVNHCGHGSIVIVTMNVVNNTVRDLKRKSESTSEPNEWVNRVREMLRNTFGMVDIEVKANSQFTSQEKFIKLIDPFFLETIKNSLYGSGGKKAAFKIFDFSYADNAEMVTKGFLILDVDKKQDWEKIQPLKSKYFINDETFRIDAPILTTREKYSIDKTLPSSNIEEFIISAGTHADDATSLNAEKLGFPVNIQTLRSYSELYKYYPTFTEILLS